MMAFLLHFFLSHRCVNHNLIFNWYNQNYSHGYVGYEEAKQLAEPFIRLFFRQESWPLIKKKQELRKIDDKNID